MEGSCAHVFEDTELLGFDCTHLVDLAHTAGLKAVAAGVVARQICCSGLVDRAVASGNVVEGGVAEEGVARIDLVASEAWTGPVREASAALEEVLGFDSVEQERRMRAVCHVLSDAIRLAEVVLEGVLAARAHCTAAVVVSIAQAALSRRCFLVRLGSRIV